MMKIDSVKKISELLKQGFNDWQDLGYVSVREYEDLRIFNYTAQAQFEARWNYFERVSRGLILNAKTGEIVARPFDKFFNWGEGNRYTNSPIQTVTEKMDGSLGILYRHNGKYCISTRGSFESDQAIWATEFLQRNYDLSDLPEGITLLFEIIYPDNRIVVDYGKREDLVLLAVRECDLGVYYDWNNVKLIASDFCFRLPTVYEFYTPEQIIQASSELGANSEGWVVEFSHGERFKFKGEEYRKLHKLIFGLSFKNTLEHISNGTLAELKGIVPDEFMEQVNDWEAQIINTVEDIESQVNETFLIAPKQSRKDFAIWVMANHKDLSHYMFAKFDKKPIKPLIYKNAFSNISQAQAV